MALLNTPTPPPAPIWVTVRFLAAEQHPVPEMRLYAFLEPESLGAAEKASLVRHSLATLKDLGLATCSEDGAWALSGGLEKAEPEDYGLFQRRLRDAVFGLHDGVSVGQAPATAHDLRRALCWFLTKDPFTESFNWANVQNVQRDHAPMDDLIIVNDTRWPSFAAWGTALGLIAPATHVQDQYVPDCTRAVRQVVEDHWDIGATLDGPTVLRLLRRHLPALPGGEFADRLGFPHEEEDIVGPALSFALLRGEHEKWLHFSSDSDARRVIKVHDPAYAYPRTYSSITRLEPIDV